MFGMPVSRNTMKRLTAFTLAFAMSVSAVWMQPSLVEAQMTDEYISGQIYVPNGDMLVSVEAVNESTREVLRRIAQAADLNLIMDASVTGTVSVELNDVSVNQALSAVATMADITIIPKSGNIYLAITRQAAVDKQADRQFSKVIRVKYSNARRLTDIINQSIFGMNPNQQQSNVAMKARYDHRTNSVVVAGTAQQIQMAEKAIRQLDMPRERKTFFLSYANALDVATQLTSSVFNDGTATLQLQGGAGGAGAGGAAGGAGAGGNNTQLMAMPSSLKVDSEDIEEGEGINDISGGAESSGALSQGITLRGTVKTTETINISPEGVLVIPDTRINAVTIMGTVQQIALAEKVIPVLDAKIPQVAIEASLVEISDTGIKQLQNNLGVALGKLMLGFNNQAQQNVSAVPNLPVTVQPAGQGLVGLPTVDANDNNSFGRTGAGFSTLPRNRFYDLTFNIRALITNNKAKLLANPTVVATHDTESVIAITDEIVRRTTIEIDGESGLTTQEIEIGEAGIVLDILPKVGSDGTVSMRLRPSVSTIRQVTQDAQGNTITLLSKRDLLTQAVRVRDGETLVIGGLVNENETVRTDKLPFLGDLPIVGALMRSVQKNGQRSELVLMITPHIIDNASLTPVSVTSAK